MSASSLLLGALMLACTPAPAAPEVPVSPTTHRVDSTTSLKAALDAYTSALHAGFADTWTIELAPGKYPGASGLTVHGPRQVQASLVLLAPDGPAVLEAPQLLAIGADVTLDGLVFAGSRSATPVLQARFARALTLRDVAFVDNVTSEPRGMALVQLSPVRNTGDKVITFDQVHFVGNGAAVPVPMVAYAHRSADSVVSLTVRGSVWAGNRYAPLLDVRTDGLVVEDTVVVGGALPGATALDRPADPAWAEEAKAGTLRVEAVGG
ncbi:MAG: hypothetical protein ACI8PZ_007474 [Myxococcota bacterium]|jgi:hypothetical protein